MGPLMLDLTGCELDREEQEILQHPTVAGVILFSRNYDSPRQIMELIGQIRHHSVNPLLIGVDHEGGRVQRFRQGFSAIPAMGSLYPKAGRNLAKTQSLIKTQQLAKEMGWLMATEVRAVGIDISFAPVLDICGISEVIGDRSFHQDPELIVAIAGEFIGGMNAAGMSAVGKHFPGHGNVLQDSHIAMPVDERSKEEIYRLDMAVFRSLIAAGKLAGMMPAHVIYPAIDDLTAGFSPLWLQQILRQELGFDGVIFSDDLGMKGASVAGSFAERATQALTAGCDVVLVCNDRAGAVQLLDRLPIDDNQAVDDKLMALTAVKAGIPPPEWAQLRANPRWQKAQTLLNQHIEEQ